MTLETFTVKQFGVRRWQQRAQLRVDKLLEIERISLRLGGARSGIQSAIEYWQEKKQQGQLPLNNYLWEPTADIVTTLVDVSPENPFHYRFMSHQLRYFPWMVGKRLDDFPHRDIVQRCCAEYVSCKSSKQPVAHHIMHDLNGFRREYVRLLLPLTDRSGRVTALACVSRHLHSPTPAAPH